MTDLTADHVHGKARAMSREKLWHENINLTLPKGAKDAMDAALAEGEDRLDLIREAISRELKRRGCPMLPGAILNRPARRPKPAQPG